MTNLFSGFLTDDIRYAQAEAYWAKIWDSTSERDRSKGGWHSGWFELQPPKDGNPIFTAISKAEHKAIRVIQYEPTSDELDIDFWIDTYGGSLVDPIAIRELVIACALTDASELRARQLISSWLIGEIEVDSSSESARGIAMIRRNRPEWQHFTADPDYALAKERPN